MRLLVLPVAVIALSLASVQANAEVPGASSRAVPAPRTDVPVKSAAVAPKAPKVKLETGKASPPIASVIHVSSHAAGASTAKPAADTKEVAHVAPKDGPPLVNGKFPYVRVGGGISNVYFHEGKVWVGSVEKPGRFILDSKHRLFSESGIGEFNSTGYRYYEKTKVTVATTAWYPGLGVDDDGHLVLHGVVHPEAGSGYSVRPITGDPRDGIGPTGGELYRNGRLVDKSEQIVLGGKKVEHALENFSLGEGSNMGPGF